MAIGLLAGAAAGAAKGLLGGAKGAAAKGAAAKGGGGKALAKNIMGRGGNDEGAKALPQAQKPTVIRAPRVDFSKIIQKLQGDKKKKEGSAIQDAFQSLKESSTNILKTLKDSVTFKRKNEKDKKQRRLNFLRGIREKAAEGGGAIFAFGKGVFKRVPFMSNILDYFKNILIGSVVMAIIQNINLIVNFLKETWEKISEFFTLVNDYFIQPIWNAAKWIAGPAVGLIADIMGKKPDPNEVRTLESDLDFILNQIPGIKDAYNALKQKAGQQPEEFDDTRGFSRGGGYRAASAPSPVAGDKEFQAGVTALAKKYDLDEDDLYAVMSFETAGTFDPAKKNMAGSEATGLVQFMPETAEGLGTTTAALAGMSRTEQLKYVDKYFANKGIQGGNLDDLYMAILFPAAVGKPDDYVLFGRGARAGYGPGSRAYSQNSGLDVNGDGSVTKAEAAAEARKHKGRAPRPPSEVAPSAPPSQQPSTGRSRARAGESRVSQDIKEFRQFRTKFGGTAERRPTSQPDYYQIREMGVYGSGNYDINPLADDTSYEIEVHKGAGHHENRAFDIPVPVNSSQGDAVNEFWKSRGYKTIWRSAGHYDHVHVEVPKNKADEFFRIMSPSPAPPSEQAQHVSRSTSYDSDKYGRTQLVAVAVPTPSGGGSSGGGIRPTISGGSRAGDTRQASRAAAQSQLFKNA